MKVNETIKAALSRLGYPDTQMVRDACTKRFIKYAYDACCIEAYTNPISIRQEAEVIGGAIYYHSLRRRPMLGKPIIEQNGQPVSFSYGNNTPNHYNIHGGVTMTVEIEYNICAPELSNEDDDLEEFTDRAENIIKHIIVMEKIHRQRRGTPMRLNEFIRIQETTDVPTDPEEGTLYYTQGPDDLYTLTFICPCGCGTIENLQACQCEKGQNPDEARRAVLRHDNHGRPYTILKRSDRKRKDVWGFEINAGRISLIGRQRKQCGSQYDVNDNIITWRLSY